MTDTSRNTAQRTISFDPIGVDCTKELQTALDVAAQNRGEVRLQAGVHTCMGIRLQPNTRLHLEEGAELHFKPDYDSYAHTQVAIEAEQSDRAMIVAKGAENISLTGRGKIFCDGSTAFSVGEDTKMGTLVPMSQRPRVMVLDGCKNVSIKGITVEDSPMWTLHFVDCESVDISELTVDNNRHMPNTDGIVIDGCKNVSIKDSCIRTADDGIVLKTSARLGGGVAGECIGVHVSNCTIESRSCALKLGTESYAMFRDIIFEDCVIEKSNRGLGIFSRDGGQVENVRFSRISVECQETPDGFWGSGEAVTINVLDRRPDQKPAGAIRSVVIEDISGSMEGAINLWAERNGDISGVVLKGLNIEQRNGVLGTSLSYDLRPTPADLEPSDDAAGRANAWRLGEDGRVIGLHNYPDGMPTIFAYNVSDLAVTDVTVDRPSPLPVRWNIANTVISADT